MPSKTRKQSRKGRRRTMKHRKHRRGGFVDYKKVKEELEKNQTFEGAKKTLDILKSLPDSGSSYGIGAVRGTATMLSTENVSDEDAKQHVKDMVEDLLIILDSLIAEQGLRGGGDSQSLIPPTDAIKVSVPDPSNKIV